MSNLNRVDVYIFSHIQGAVMVVVAMLMVGPGVIICYCGSILKAPRPLQVYLACEHFGSHRVTSLSFPNLMSSICNLQWS